MTELAVFAIVGADKPASIDRDRADIAAHLAAIGGELSRVDPPGRAVPADDAKLIAAYAPRLAALRAKLGTASVDVVRVRADKPLSAETRAKFAEEHTHDEPEARVFVAGRGSFFLRIGKGAVARLTVEAGDAIVVPAGLPHWFDAGAEPDFVAIRLLGSAEGWHARPTGDALAAGFAGHIDHDSVAEPVNA